jgi:hypothetical protein
MTSILKTNTIQDLSSTVLLETNGSGTITTNNIGGQNTPAFYAYATTGTSIAFATNVKINLQAEYFDTDSAFDTSNARFTVPTGKAGKYFFNGQIAFGATINDNHVGFAKNGSTTVVGGSYDTFFEAKGANASTVSTSVVIDLDAGDYVEMFTFNTNGSVPTTSTGRTRFFGYRIIGA